MDREVGKLVGIIFLIVVLVVVAGIIIFLSIQHPERRLDVGAHIESIQINDNLAQITLSGGANDKEIERVKFIFTDSKGVQHYYFTTEGIVNLSQPYKKSIVNLFKEPDFQGTYKYTIDSNEIGFTNFDSIYKVEVVFDYEKEGLEIDKDVSLDSEVINEDSNPSRGGGGGGGSSFLPDSDLIPILRAYWKYSGNEVTELNDMAYGTSLRLVLENSGLRSGTSAEFTIYEKDWFGDDYMAKVNTNVGSDGYVSINWIINETHVQAAKGFLEGRLELYFEVNGVESEVLKIGFEEIGIEPNCSDRIQNQNETGVDCGGECGDCVEDADPNYTLIWEDNFNGSELDPSKWDTIPSATGSDWDKYMSNDPLCFDMTDGKLYLKGILNPDTLSGEPRTFLTGGVYTKDIFDFQYGKIEVRAMLESAQGAWPAIWMLSQDQKYGGYPRNGEIDIMEHVNYQGYIHQTTHSYWTLDMGQDDNPPNTNTVDVDVSQFNIYGLEWYKDSLVFTLNGVPTFTYPKIEDLNVYQWPYDQPFYIMLSQQLGGAWAGTIDKEDLPVQMVVDYVRVYERTTDPPVETFLINGLYFYSIPPIKDEKILPDSGVPSKYFSQEISLTSAPGEFEPGSFIIKSDQDIDDMSLEVSSLTKGGDIISSENIDLKLVKVWYQSGEPIWEVDEKILTPELLLNDDSLVKVENGENYLKMNTGEYVWISEPDNQTGWIFPTIEEFPVIDSDILLPFNLTKDKNKQVWMTIKIPDGTPPGDYTGTLTLRDSSTTLGKIQINVEVLPIDLLEPSVEYSIYYLGRLADTGTISGREKNEEQFINEMQNMYDHGISNPTMEYQNGEDKLLRALEIRNQVGMDNSNLYSILGFWKTGEPGLGFNTFGSDLASLTNAVSELQDLTAGSGVTQVYIYGPDEQSIDDPVSRAQMQAIHDAGGKTFNSQDNFPSEQEAESVADILDLANHASTPNKTLAEKYHSYGHKIYSYGNPQVGEENPEKYRRNYGLVLWQNDYDGAMDFAYTVNFYHIWNDFDFVNYRDHNFVYPTMNGIIDTVAWEGFREGVDDMKYFTTLLETIQNAKNQGEDTSYIEAWVDELKNYNLETKDLDEIRAKMIESILYLQGDIQNYCGNEVAESGEECDGNDLQGTTCTGLGYTGGTLSCTDSCEIDESFCTPKNNPLSFITPASDNEVTTQNQAEIEMGEIPYQGSSLLNWDNSLTAWWRMDDIDANGRVVDYIGDDIGRIVGDTFQTPDGKLGDGFQFGGSGDYIYSDTFNIGGYDSLTISLWFKVFDKTKQQYLLYRDGELSILLSGTSSGDIFVRTYGLSRFIDNWKTNSVIKNDTWHHLVLTYDGSYKHLYIDGLKIGYASIASRSGIPETTGTITTNGVYEFFISIPTINSFNGTLDDIMIFNRSLSDLEIKSIYNSKENSYYSRFDNLPEKTYSYKGYYQDPLGNVYSTEERNIIVTNQGQS